MNREHCANAAGRKQRKCAKKRFSLLYSIPILIFTFLGAPEIVLAVDFTGLWVGQIEIAQINEVGHPTDTVTPTDVAHPFDMRILLHSEDTDLADETNAETVRLLKRVTVMGRRYEVEVEDGVYEERIERLLVTDDSILGDYEEVVEGIHKIRTLDLWEIKAGTEFNCQSLGLLTHRILSFLFRDTLFLSY